MSDITPTTQTPATPAPPITPAIPATLPVRLPIDRLQQALGDAAMVDTDSVADAADALERASEFLEEFGLSTNEVDDLAARLREVEETVSDIESEILALAVRSMSEWPADGLGLLIQSQADSEDDSEDDSD